MIKVKVMFYRGLRDSEKSIGGFFFYLMVCINRFLGLPGTGLEHTALFIDVPGAGVGVYHVGPKCKSRWCRGKVYNDLLPACGVKLGEIPHTIENMNIIGDVKSIGFNTLLVVYWYLIGRWISKWKPAENCTMKTCEILNNLGYSVEYNCVPSLLWKELKENANDNNCWESWSWQNNTG